MLSAVSFDMKCRFIQDLRRKFGGGTFNLAGSVGGSRLADYYRYLKDDVQMAPQRFFKETHLGYQRDKYWILSKEVKHFTI